MTETRHAMPRHLHDVAREAADDAIQTAQAAGWRVSDHASLFIRADSASLVDAIHRWLDDHMVKA